MLRNTHRTLASVALDVEPAPRPVCYQCLALLGLGTGRSAPNVG